MWGLQTLGARVSICINFQMHRLDEAEPHEIQLRIRLAAEMAGVREVCEAMHHEREVYDE